MISKEKIEQIVSGVIHRDEDIGERAGGSGHMSDTAFTIDEISEPVEVSDGWEIEYRYTTMISTEFTYEPDNPPYRYHHTKIIIINENGSIVKEFEKSTSPADDNSMPYDLDLPIDL